MIEMVKKIRMREWRVNCQLSAISCRQLFFVLLFISFSLPVFSQDLKKDMQNMVSYYNNAASLSINIKVNVYQDKSSSASLAQNAKIRKKGRNFFYELNDTRMLLSEKSLLMIHENEKDILCRDITSKEYDEFLKNFITSNLDSVISSYDSLKFKGNIDNDKYYVVYTPKGAIVKTDLYINASSHGLSKLVYYYNDLLGAYYKVEIFFNNSTATVDNDVFSEEKYIIKSGGKYKLTPAYSNYHLIIAEHDED
jgi:hypothetical protein